MADTASDDLAAARNHAGRLATFAPYQIRDTPREAEDDDVVALTAQVGGAPIAVVVNELVTKAVKHARARHIAVRVEAAGDHGLRLSVSDDGVGLPANFDPCATGASLGMRIITSLLRQLSASLRWSNEGDGARFTIELPEAPQAAARSADA